MEGARDIAILWKGFEVFLPNSDFYLRGEPHKSMDHHFPNLLILILFEL